MTMVVRSFINILRIFKKLVEKYGIESGSEGIIVECGDKSKVLTSSDLVTYDTTTYETISIAEQKLTSSIIAVATDKVPKVYFLEGYSDYLFLLLFRL